MTRHARRRIGAAVLGVGATAAAATIAARRDGSSIRGWIVARLVVPLLYGRRRGPGGFHLAIAEDRARGPALPSRSVQARYRFTDKKAEGDDIRRFRLAPAAGAASALHILYIHGGAYVFDLMATQWPMVTGLVDRTGAAVTIPLYPLAPESDVDRGLAAVEHVYRRLVAEAGAGSVVVCGDSAGGGLALALAQRLRDRGDALPAALLLFFPWLDVTCSGEDQPALIAEEPLLAVDELRQAGSWWAGAHDAAAAPASPLSGDLSDLPPMLVLAGTRDMLLSDSRRLAARQPAVTLREYPGMFHGWMCAPIPEARRALDEAARFVLRHAAA